MSGRKIRMIRNQIRKQEQENQQIMYEQDVKTHNERSLFYVVIGSFVFCIILYVVFIILPGGAPPILNTISFVSGYTTGTYYVPCIIYLVYLSAIYGIVGPKPRLRKIYYIGITLFGVMGIGYIIWDLPYLLATYPPQVAPGAFDETTAIFSQLFAFFSVHGLLSGIYQIPPYLPKDFSVYRTVFAEDYKREPVRPEIRWAARYFTAYFGLPDATEEEQPKTSRKWNRWSWKDEEGRKNVVTLVMLIGIIAMWAFGIHNVQIGWVVYTGLTIISAMVMILLRVRKKQQTPEDKNIDI